MLLCVSLLVYGLLAWLMPQTYSNRLNAALDERTQAFISELEQVAFSDSGGLFDQFVQSMGINSIELYDQDGFLIPLPSEQLFNEQSTYNEEATVVGFDKSSPVLASNYFFLFLIVMTVICLLFMEQQSRLPNCNNPFYTSFHCCCSLLLQLPLPHHGCILKLLQSQCWKSAVYQKRCLAYIWSGGLMNNGQMS